MIVLTCVLSRVHDFGSVLVLIVSVLLFRSCYC